MRAGRGRVFTENRRGDFGVRQEPERMVWPERSLRGFGAVLPVYRLQCFRAVTGGVNHRREEGKDGGGQEKGGKGNGLWFRASASRVWGEDGSRRRSDFSRKSRETTCENIAVPALVAPGPRSLAGGPGPRFAVRGCVRPWVFSPPHLGLALQVCRGAGPCPRQRPGLSSSPRLSVLGRRGVRGPGV